MILAAMILAAMILVAIILVAIIRGIFILVKLRFSKLLLLYFRLNVFHEMLCYNFIIIITCDSFIITELELSNPNLFFRKANRFSLKFTCKINKFMLIIFSRRKETRNCERAKSCEASGRRGRKTGSRRVWSPKTYCCMVNVLSIYCTFDYSFLYFS